MKNCVRCQQPLLDDARFCHHCGAKAEGPEVACPHCQEPNPPDARFCAHCGQSMADPGSRDAWTPIWSPQDVANRFFDYLKDTVREEQDAESYAQYLQRFSESDFQEVFDIRVVQLAEEADTIARREGQGSRQVSEFLLIQLTELVDFFMLRYCRDLLAVHIPEKVLKYQQDDPKKIDHFAMTMDFLDFPSVPEKVYTNLLEMPVDKLRHATHSFLFPEKAERIYFICDLSLLGNCKEGFAMTDRAVYWRSPMEKARKVAFEDLQLVVREKGWLRINELYFHASLVLDIRLLKLLRKIMANQAQS